MDPDVGRWLLEYLLRNSTTVTHTLINKIVLSVPLSNTDSRLKKTILLRTLQDHLSTASISETMLETLEVLEELHRSDGSPITTAMSSAYCAIAVECTLKYLEVSLSNNPAYLNAVDRIWRSRIRYMEPSAFGSGSLLFSSELNRWKSDIEASLLDSRVMERLANINTRRDALYKLKVYLAEAWADMGPSFLELVASLPANKDLQRLTVNLVDDNPTDTGGRSVCDLVLAAEPTSGENEGTDRRGACIGTHATELDGSGLPSQEEREIQKDNQPHEVKCTATGAEEFNPSTTCRKIDSVPSHEVQIVRESPKCSSLELQTLVNDPPSEALHTSDVIMRSDLEIKEMNPESPIDNQSREAHAPERHVCQGINNNDNKVPSVSQSDVHRPGLMERNSTACTYEWDDSIDGLQTSNHASRFHLPSPRRKNVSPLKKYEPENLTKRRKPKKWSELEEETLRTAVKIFGKGNWKLILSTHRDIFEERTEVDLKDKWRNMTRYGGK